MYDPKYNKESRSLFLFSGGFGCLPSLIFFLILLIGDFSYGLNGDAAISFMSVFFGLAGVIGILIAITRRTRENHQARTNEQKVFRDEE